MVCEKCGEELSEECMFCPKCGWPVSEKEEEQERTDNKEKTVRPVKTGRKRWVVTGVILLVTAGALAAFPFIRNTYRKNQCLAVFEQCLEEKDADTAVLTLENGKEYIGESLYREKLSSISEHVQKQSVKVSRNEKDIYSYDYGYDGSGNVVNATVVYPGQDLKAVVEYDGNMNITSRTIFEESSGEERKNLYGYNDENRMVEEYHKLEDGTDLKINYDNEGNVVSVERYGSSENPVMTGKRRYDENNCIEKATDEVYNPEYVLSDYSYDSYGNEIKCECYNEENLFETSSSDLTYDEKGNLTDECYYFGGVFITEKHSEYDGDRLIADTTVLGSGITHHNEYAYNERGDCISELQKDDMGNIISDITHELLYSDYGILLADRTYDSGKIESETVYNCFGEKISANFSDKARNSDLEMQYFYNEHGDPVKCCTYGNGELEQTDFQLYEYNSNGDKIIKIACRNSALNGFEITGIYHYSYEYNEYGDKIAEVQKDDRGRIVSKYQYSYQYDENGRKTEEIQSDGLKQRKCIYGYKYNWNGDCTEKSVDFGNETVTYCYRYQYQFF